MLNNFILWFDVVELEKTISCYFYLKNQMDNNVAFKVIIHN